MSTLITFLGVILKAVASLDLTTFTIWGIYQPKVPKSQLR